MTDMAIAQAEGQISMFDVLEERDWFRDTLIRQLKRGSGFEHAGLDSGKENSSTA